MKFYIATSLSRMDSHQIVKDSLKKLGHTITYDWTLHGSVKSISKERLREVASCELNGVTEADFVIVLLPGGKGTHLELGFAIAKGKRVFLHCEDLAVFELGPQTCAFYHHPDITRLHCPLADVGLNVNALLMQTATVSNKDIT